MQGIARDTLTDKRGTVQKHEMKDVQSYLHGGIVWLSLARALNESCDGLCQIQCVGFKTWVG